MWNSSLHLHYLPVGPSCALFEHRLWLCPVHFAPAHCTTKTSSVPAFFQTAHLRLKQSALLCTGRCHRDLEFRVLYLTRCLAVCLKDKLAPKNALLWILSPRTFENDLIFQFFFQNLNCGTFNLYFSNNVCTRLDNTKKSNDIWMLTSVM